MRRQEKWRRRKGVAEREDGSCCGIVDTTVLLCSVQCKCMVACAGLQARQCSRWRTTQVRLAMNVLVS